MKHNLVLGCGESGASAALLLSAKGEEVTVVDGANTPRLRERAAQLTKHGVAVRLGVAQPPDVRFDLCVVSPGIPTSSGWVRDARARGIQVLSELEIGWRYRKGPVVAVTGSNGKSTAVHWLVHAMRKSGLRVAACGNGWRPISSIALQPVDYDWLVVEVSSFQLETVERFRAHCSLLLNCLPNHLDRHGTMEEYIRVKSKIFSNASSGDVCIAPGAWYQANKHIDVGNGRWVTFGLDSSDDYRYEDNAIYCRGRQLGCLEGTPFANPVLGRNAAGVVATLRSCDVPVSLGLEAGKQLSCLPFRLQRIATIGGVSYINDSKATNLAALGAALSVLPSGIHLIAGGRAKEFSGNILEDQLEEKVKRVYLIGEAADALAATWQTSVDCLLCETLEVAFQQATAHALSGELVLLSPGCASFDQYKDFKDRGLHFNDLVIKLVEEGRQCMTTN